MRGPKIMLREELKLLIDDDEEYFGDKDTEGIEDFADEDEEDFGGKEKEEEEL